MQRQASTFISGYVAPSSSRTIIMPWSCCKLVPAESRRMQIDAWMMLYVHASCSRIPTSSG
jgi:hypothetical protein